VSWWFRISFAICWFIICLPSNTHLNVQSLDWKGGQTSSFDWSCMVWVIVMIIKTIGTSYLQNIFIVKIICVCEEHLKSKRKCMAHHIIPSMAKVVFYWWGLYILLWGQVFAHVPLSWGFHITSLVFQELTHMCMCYV
jgi:hypothetical protein